MDDDQQFCLRWNNHQSTLISVFDTLLENGTLVDCTLAAEGKFLKAHKVVLSACSPYFATLLSQQYDKHPIFILKDVKFQELRAMMDYMYRGEVNISQDQLAALLKAAESLQIKGLSDSRGTSSTSSSSHNKDHLQKAKMDGRNITITEQKRQKLGGHHAPTTVDHSIEMTSREGSASPTSRKRKKTRRRSTEAATNAAAIAAAAAAANNLSDHHDQHSNSSFHSLSAVGGASAAATAASLVSSSATTSAQQQQTIGSSTSIVTGALVGGVVGSGQTTHITTSSAILLQPATTSTTTTSSSSSTSANVTKKTEQLIHDTKLETEIDDEEEQDHHHQMKIQQQQQQQQHHDHSDDGDDDDDDDEDSEPEQLLQQQRKRPRRHVGGVDNGKSKMDTDMMIEPKSEYEDGQDEPVEDLTLDDEELMEDLDQAGPSHGGGGAGGTSGAGGEGSSQGYAAWQVDRPQDEVFLNAQETGGQHRDTQALLQKAPANDILRLHQHHQQQQQQQSLSSSKSSGGSQGSTPTSSDMNLYQQITTTTTTASSGAKNHPRIKYSGIKNIITQQQQQQRQQQHQQEQQQQQEQTTLADSIHSTSATDLMMGEFVKYADIDDIELADGTQIGYHPATKYETTTQPTATIITTKDNHSPPPAAVSSVVALTIKTAPTTPTANNAVLVKGAKTSPSQSDGATGGVHNNQNVSETSFSMAEKYSIIAANALKNFDFSSLDLNSSVEDGEKLYSCQHCGKKYRWKSTLRRHENDECGNKEPAHQCPYCPYKAKQRGNLGVHVRKHHSELPQLESRRKKRGSI